MPIPLRSFTGLDKITGRITVFDVYIDETVQFGSLQMTPSRLLFAPCHRGPERDGVRRGRQVSLRATVRRIFSGWMFADSPALNAIDDAVYDVWLVDCRQSSDVPPPTSGSAAPQKRRQMSARVAHGLSLSMPP